MPNTSDTIKISSSFHEYKVFLNSSFGAYTFPQNSLLIADERFRDSFVELDVRQIYLTASEDHKSLEVCTQVLSRMHQLGANKSTKIVSVGGGIIQDITTLVASLYMRGLDWIYFPTTSMSQLDSCLGGKSSINLHGNKNIVGNIYPPVEIHIDNLFNSTLASSALASGYLEAIKISFAHGDLGFIQHANLADGYVNLDMVPSIDIAKLVLNQKKFFIEQDEFDLGIRQLLNYGHTFGHAIESATTYDVPHGIAIGLGMLMANLHPASSSRGEVSTLNGIIWNILKQSNVDITDLLNRVQDESFITFFLADKKHKDGNYSIIIAGDEKLEKFSSEWNLESRNLILKLLHQVRLEAAREIQ